MRSLIADDAAYKEYFSMSSSSNRKVPNLFQQAKNSYVS